MRHIIHQETTFLHRLTVDACFHAEELSAIIDEHSLHDKRDAGPLTRSQALGAEFDPDSDVQLQEPLHVVEVPRVQACVVDGGSQDQHSIQLSDSVCRAVDRNAVQQGVLKSGAGVHLNVEERAWHGREGEGGGEAVL